MVSYKNLNFNSIKVRLELAYSTLHKYLYHNFNSIKVRLEPTPHFFDVTFSEFQFHKGTIRTGYGGTLGVLSVEFQFHKGTIRTLGFYHREIGKAISIP